MPKQTEKFTETANIKTLKDNYGSFNMLLVLSKLFERLLSKQLAEFFERILSKCQCGSILVKTMVRNIVYKWCLNFKKKLLIIKIKRLEHCWQIYLKHLFAGVMIYWLLTFMQMVSTYSPMPNCSGIKVQFCTNFPTHFTLSFSTFTRVWLEKVLLSF